jgi:adenylate kinase
VNILLLGPPGAGKGTQGERVAEHLGVRKLATGDVLRAAVREGTPMGREAKAYMDRGDLVPDGVILGIMKEVLAGAAYERGVILDGVVRTVPQAEGLQRVLRELGREVDAVLLFNVGEQELVQRLSGRTVCETCQTPYSGLEPGAACARCGGRLVRRKDDEPEAVRRRLHVYMDQTQPVVEWYRAHDTCFIEVDAVGEIEEITARVLRDLDGCDRRRK